MKELIFIILIYILSSFHICIWEDCTHNFEYKSENSFVSAYGYKNIGFWKKVIATTDKSLSQTNRTEIPQPSEQFIQKYIEEYNRGNIITDVLVEYEQYDKV